MKWDDAVAWADQLVYGGYDDWRLPSVLPVNGSTYNYTQAHDGSSDKGWNVSAPGSAHPGSTASEMAHLYYVSLGNLGYYEVDGDWQVQPGWGLGNTGPFINLQTGYPSYYWSGTEYQPNNNIAFAFNMKTGEQHRLGKHYHFYVWAVRDVSALTPNPQVLHE